MQAAGDLVLPARRHLEGRAEQQARPAHQREQERRGRGLHAAQQRGRGAGPDQVQERADGAEREERVADEQHADMDEDPVALQRRDERLDLLVGDERGLSHRHQGEGDRQYPDDPQTPFPLDDQVADHHRPGDEVQRVEEVRVGRMRDHVPEAVGRAEDVSRRLAREDLDAARGHPPRHEVGGVRGDRERGERRGGPVELQLLHRETGSVPDEGGRVGRHGDQAQPPAEIEQPLDRFHSRPPRTGHSTPAPAMRGATMPHPAGGTLRIGGIPAGLGLESVAPRR